MSRCFPKFKMVLLFLLLGLVTWSTVAAETLNQMHTASQINSLIRQERRDEALPLCRLYTAEFPDNPVMLYNLACLENTAGNVQQAIEAYRKALEAGFSEFELAAEDPDLQGNAHELILEMNLATRNRLAVIAAGARLTLDHNQWSEPRQLTPHGATARPTVMLGDRPQLSLLWGDNGLEFELTATGQWREMFAVDTQAPWQGGPGLLFSLGMLTDPDDLESTNHFLFAFGFEAKGGVGGMYISTQGQWQRVAELAPKIKIDETGPLRLSAMIPWQALMPYNPLVDTPIGFNATLIRRENGQLHRATLLETSDTMDPLANRRRLARLDFRTDSIVADTFLGKLSNSISRNQPLDLDLVAISTEAGTATLSLNFTDQAGRSVLPAGPIQGTVSLRQGTNHIDRQADFGSLKTGGYIMQTEMVFPSGHRDSWSGTVLQLADRWQQQYEENISLVAMSEQTTVQYLLDTIVAAAANHQPRRSPGAIVTTLIDLEQMLADAEEYGSILPKKGSFVFIYPGAKGQNMVCRMYLPAGREIADGINPIVVFSPGGGHEASLAARIGRNYEHGQQMPTLKSGLDDKFPVYLVPELPAAGGVNTADFQAEADACLNWAMTYFQTPKISVVGIDARGSSALLYARQAADRMNGILVFAGQNLNPWPQAQPEYIRGQLGSPTDLVPITWVDFPSETSKNGQAIDILQALKQLKYQIGDEQTVRGSLNLTQAADRLVIWAEGLR